MGWSLKIKETKKGVKKYKFWTSVSGGWINEKWLTRDEMIKFLFWYRFEKMVDDFTKDAMTFPNGWSAKGEMRRLPIDEEMSDAYFDWQQSTFGLRGSDYPKAIYAKFSEMLDKYEINVSVHDGKYNFNNTEGKSKDYSSEALTKLNEQSYKEVEEIAKEYGLNYGQAVALWNKMNKQYNKMRDPLHPANFKESE